MLGMRAPWLAAHDSLAVPDVRAQGDMEQHGMTEPTPAHMTTAWQIVDAFRERLVGLENLCGDDNWRSLANQIGLELARTSAEVK